MKKLIKISYLLIFLLILIIPLCLTNTNRNVKSDLDNRVLTEFPEIGTAGFEQKVTSYLQDRIGLRDQIVTGYQLLNNTLAGELTHPIYSYGRDGYMFMGMHNNIRYGAYHKTFAEAVRKMQQYCESRGVKFYFLFDPEKISVYRRYLPTGVIYNDEWVDELLEYMKSLGIRCISNRELLIDLSYKEQVFNRQYDAGHWNDLGCFYGTNNLWKEISKDFPNVTEYTEDDFNVSSKNEQFLTASRFPVNESVPDYELKTEWTDKTKDYSAIKINKRYPYFRYYVNTSNKAKDYPKMLIFHGSYYNRGPKFFVGRAQEYIGIHDYQNVLNLDYYFNIFQPDLVVFEVAEYTITDQYFSRNAMADLNYNPSLIRNQESIETAIGSAKNHAEEYTTESDTKWSIIQHDGFDTIYIEKDLSSARYIYLLTDDQIFDLQEDSHGYYSTGIPHGAVTDKATLFYEDYTGHAYYSEINTQFAVSYIEDTDNTFCTPGVTYDASKQYVFTTTANDNEFNTVSIQLLNAVTGEYLGPLLSVSETGTVNGSFIHEEENGWYLVRIKANGTTRDEAVDILSYLLKGKKYYYSINLIDRTKKQIRIGILELFGPSTINPETQELIGTVNRSEDVEELSHSRFRMRTEIEGNAFNSVALQLYNPETVENSEPISLINKTGIITGRYYHNTPFGKFTLRLRSNSNLQDEYIEAEIELQQNEMYKWSYEVESFAPNEVIIKNFSFKSMGSPFDE